ncbi:nuclear transport factor 2 family protein [Enterovibrio norvegicus]|uniref:nuclear transport factor 2 family protein n=1 Tax=Enterovibrio norvegicus TaxID=188144 RepID=UPI0035503248
MSAERKQWIHDLLKKGIENGDAHAVAVVDESQYVQHNPMTKEGGIGLAELFTQLAKTNPHVEIIRIFSDGDYIFAHTEYDFSSEKICFEVFRFEGDKTVEHWDNLQLKHAPNASGHSMTDGSTQVTDIALTESNRATINAFVQDVLINKQAHLMLDYMNANNYTEHNPQLSDDIDSLIAALGTADQPATLLYETHHRTLAEGNFVLSVCEGFRMGEHTAFYDLYRLENGKIVEHWDTVETVPPRSVWNNENGKF